MLFASAIPASVVISWSAIVAVTIPVLVPSRVTSSDVAIRASVSVMFSDPDLDIVLLPTALYSVVNSESVPVNVATAVALTVTVVLASRAFKSAAATLASVTVMLRALLLFASAIPASVVISPSVIVAVIAPVV